MSQRLLLVDDDTAILDALGRFLEREGFEVLVETRGQPALDRYREERADIVLLDLKLPDVEHLEILEQLRALNASVVLLTGHGDVQTAVEAMQLGAESFLTKPVELEHLIAVLRQVLEKNRLIRENERLRKGGAAGEGLDALGVSAPMRELARQIEMLARSERTTVLLTGESGTGKGWVARQLHSLSPRGRRSFVEVNSAGLTSTFLVSELFGHEKGAFTDARERRDGLFLEADRGTLFLDEIGEMSPEVQPRLLNVLETRTFRRLGGTEELHADVRLIAATNQDLTAQVEAGDFREDLYYRLNVAAIHLPALRDRTDDDRLALLHGLLGQLRQEIPGSPDRIGEDALEVLLSYSWPGNIREMKNSLERALIFGAGGGSIRRSHLPTELVESTTRGGRKGFQPRSLEEVEARHIERMLLHHRGNRTRAADDLGIARTTLLNKIRKYDLEL